MLLCAYTTALNNRQCTEYLRVLHPQIHMPITSHSLLPAPKHFVHRRRVKNQAQNTASYGRQLGLLKSNSGRTARESSLVALASEDSVEAGPSLRRNPLYVEACRYALRRRYDEGRLAFEKLLSHEPHLCRGWVSYAQVRWIFTTRVCMCWKRYRWVRQGYLGLVYRFYRVAGYGEV